MSKNNFKLAAAIVPAYNEEKTIGQVVKVLVASNRFSDIIVISDGSTDRTAEMARNSGATVTHQFPINRGKGAALQHGVGHTDAEILFFCDADLIGFTPEHVNAILDPVVQGKLAMNVGLRDRGPLITALMRYLPLIGGERAMRRQVFEKIQDRHLRGFMVESALNYYCRSRKLPYGTVVETGLTMRKKMQKVGVWRGLAQYVGMTMQIIKAMLIVKIDRLLGRF